MISKTIVFLLLAFSVEVFAVNDPNIEISVNSQELFDNSNESGGDPNSNNHANHPAAKSLYLYVGQLSKVSTSIVGPIKNRKISIKWDPKVISVNNDNSGKITFVGADSFDGYLSIKAIGEGETNLSIGVNGNYCNVVWVKTSCAIDLWVDSNNNGAADSEDEEIEDNIGRTGRIIRSEDDKVDNDADAIPDYADGIDVRKNIVEDDIVNTDIKYEYAIVSIPENIPPSSVSVKFIYSATDPGGVTFNEANHTYQIPEGHLRLWRKDYAEIRNKNSILSGGDYVAKEEEFNFTELREFGSPHRRIIYIEGIRNAHQFITVVGEMPALYEVVTPSESSGPSVNYSSGEEEEIETVSCQDEVLVNTVTVTPRFISYRDRGLTYGINKVEIGQGIPDLRLWVNSVSVVGDRLKVDYEGYLSDTEVELMKNSSNFDNPIIIAIGDQKVLDTVKVTYKESDTDLKKRILDFSFSGTVYIDKKQINPSGINFYAEYINRLDNRGYSSWSIPALLLTSGDEDIVIKVNEDSVDLTVDTLIGEPVNLSANGQSYLFENEDYSISLEALELSDGGNISLKIFDKSKSVYLVNYFGPLSLLSAESKLFLIEGDRKQDLIVSGEPRHIVNSLWREVSPYAITYEIETGKKLAGEPQDDFEIILNGEVKKVKEFREVK